MFICICSTSHHHRFNSGSRWSRRESLAGLECLKMDDEVFYFSEDLFWDGFVSKLVGFPNWHVLGNLTTQNGRRGFLVFSQELLWDGCVKKYGSLLWLMSSSLSIHCSFHKSINWSRTSLPPVYPWPLHDLFDDVVGTRGKYGGIRGNKLSQKFQETNFHIYFLTEFPVTGVWF